MSPDALRMLLATADSTGQAYSLKVLTSGGFEFEGPHHGVTEYGAILISDPSCGDTLVDVANMVAAAIVY